MDPFYIAPVENIEEDADDHPWNYWIIDRATDDKIADYRTLRYAKRAVARLNATRAKVEAA